MLTVDAMIGDLRAEFAAQGRDPIWMFTSDNGMALGVDGYALKNVPQASRLPVLFSGPDVVPGATDAVVSNIDVAPTLADLAGITLPWADGVSFASVLRGEGGGREWMLEDHPLGGYTGARGSSGPWWGIRTPSWHLVEWNGTHLYDLAADPLNEVDVSAEHPDKIAELMGIADREFARINP